MRVWGRDYTVPRDFCLSDRLDGYRYIPLPLGYNRMLVELAGFSFHRASSTNLRLYPRGTKYVSIARSQAPPAQRIAYDL